MLEWEQKHFSLSGGKLPGGALIAHINTCSGLPLYTEKRKPLFFLISLKLFFSSTRHLLLDVGQIALDMCLTIYVELLFSLSVSPDCYLPKIDPPSPAPDQPTNQPTFPGN